MTANQAILPGDKVATWKDLVFLHPLVHVGDGWFVEKAKTGWIQLRHWSSFPPGLRLQVVQRPPAHEANRVADRALSRLGWEPYDPVNANCQHFANEVLTGQRKSEQVELVLTALGVGVVVLLLGAMFKS